MREKSGDKRANALMLEALNGFRGRVLLIIAGRVSQSGAYLLFVLLSRELIDSAVAGDFTGLWRAAILLSLTVLLRLFLSYSLKWLNNSTQRKATIAMRERLYADVLQKQQHALGEYHSAALLERMTGDLMSVISYGIVTVPDYIGSLSGLLGAVWALFSINRLLPAALIAAGLLLCFAGRLVQNAAKRRYRLYVDEAEQARAYYQESLANSLMLKVFGAQRQASARADAFERSVFSKWKRWYAFNQVLNSGVSSFFQLGYLGALIFSAILLANGQMTFGSMAALLQLIDDIMDPFSSVGGLLSAKYTAQASAERILEIKDLPAEPQDAPSDGWELYGGMATLSVSHVTFGYGREAVLKDASAELKKGEFVVVSGRSGIGKSTLIQLLLGVYADFEGRLELVSASGARTPLNAKTRALFAYVPQQHMVFGGSVRDNLCFLCGQMDDGKIWEAARLADAEDFLRKLPEGLDTRLGEQGVGLSQGQAQRLAIARALLKRAPILVLDEATSALDEDTEKRVLQNIRSLGDITLLIISHRRAAYDICDREWRMADGMIEGRVIAHDS